MAIQQNFPEDGPTLNLNFAGSKTLDPRITFARTSAGTCMDENGLIKVVPANEPRFDHSYVNGGVESLGLLIEEQRSNLVEDSNSFGGSFSSISTESTILDPSGSTSTQKVQSNISSGNAWSSTYNVITNSSGTSVTYCWSTFVKRGSYSTFSAQFGLYNQGRVDYNFDTDTLTVNANADGGGRILYPNGWVRIYGYKAIPDTTSFNLINVLRSVEEKQGVNTFIYQWGAQVEAGSFPTSYIPTSGSTATRNADNASITGSNFSSWYNQGEGTVYADTTMVGVQTGRYDRLWAITNSNLNQDGLGLFISGPSGTFGIYDITATIGGVTQYPEAGGTLSTSGMGITASSTPRLKSCFGFTIGNTNISYNGRLPNSSGVTITNLLNADRLLIGQPQRFQGHSCMTVSQLTYYPRRLTNEQLQNLTK